MTSELQAAAALPEPPPRRRVRSRSRGPHSGALFFGVVAVPALVFYAGLAGSFAAGTVIVALALLLLPFAPAAATSASPMRRASVRLTPWVVCIIALHFAVAAQRAPVSAGRALASLGLLALVLVASGALADRMLAIDDKRFEQGMLRAFGWMCVLALLSSIGFSPPTLADAWRKPVFPFSEPSTFALAFIPALMFVAVATRSGLRIALVLAGLVCSALVQNLTLACGVLLVAAVALPLPALLLVAPPTLFAVTQLDLSYFVERLDFSGESTNLSNLVFVQGWQMIEESLVRSRGFGLGFQQLGVNGTDVLAAQVIRLLLDGEDMNLLDGGFFFAKMGSDFGALGVVLAIGHVLLAVRSGWRLRRAARGQLPMRPAMILAHAVVLTFVIEMFVRSVGYFSGTAMLFAASLWLVTKEPRKQRP